MTVGLHKVRSGDSLVIPATAYNAFVDAALAHQQRQRNSTPGGDARELPSASYVPLRNDSGQDQPRFAVLGVSGPIITRAADADTFKHRVMLRGVVPTADHAGRFAVLLTPLPNGDVGQACVDGVCIAQVEMASESHRFAEVVAGQTTILRSAASGSAVILWCEPVLERETTSVAWAVIRLGGGGGGGTSLAFCQIVAVVGTAPPYVIKAKDVTWANGGFGAPTGSDFDLLNLDERGPNGTGARKLQVGDQVPYWRAADGTAFTTRSNYRGTYP